MKTTKRKLEPAYIIGRSANGWHSQQRERWTIAPNPENPEYPHVSTESVSCSGIKDDEIKARIVPGCICYDLEMHGWEGGCAACSLPSRRIGESDRDHALIMWRALLDIRTKFPDMKLGIAVKAKVWPWE
jgi:hypothetical protein